VTGAISERTISDIRDRADIVEVISPYVPLKKAGRNFVGLCPFHSEKTPSFSVNPEKGIYKCFGCGKGGDAFAFIMEMEGLSFVEAVKDLGSRFGIEVKTESRSDKEADSRNETLFSINEVAQRFFYDNLKSQEGKMAVEYLKARGIDGQTASRFKLGYALPRWDSLFSRLQKEARADLLIASGLAIRGDRGTYDRFRGRIIFPISGTRGRMIGFGGRVLDNTEPKYLNSPETPIYHKGKVLYGLDLAKDEIRRAGKAIIVEGYLDLISLHIGSIKNVVATLGTALTSDHLRLLKRYTQEVIILFDGDESGVKAAERTLPLFSDGTIFARAAILPGGEDPDSFIRKNGEKRFSDLVESAGDLYEFCLNQIFSRHDLKTPKGVSLALDEACAAIALKKMPHERDFYIEKITSQLSISEDSVRERLKNALNKGTNRAKASTSNNATPNRKNESIDKRDKDLFKIAVNFPRLFSQSGFTEEHLDLIQNEYIKDVIFHILNSEYICDEKPASLSALLSDAAFDDVREILNRYSYIDEGEVADDQTALSIVGGYLDNREDNLMKRDSRAINKELRSDKPDDEKRKLLKKKIELVKSKKR